MSVLSEIQFTEITGFELAFDDDALFIEGIIAAWYLIAIFVPHKIEMHAAPPP